MIRIIRPGKGVEEMLIWPGTPILHPLVWAVFKEYYVRVNMDTGFILRNRFRVVLALAHHNIDSDPRNSLIPLGGIQDNSLKWYLLSRSPTFVENVYSLVERVAAVLNNFGVAGMLGSVLPKMVRGVYVAFELTAFVALALAALLSFTDLISFIVSRGFVHHEVLSRILSIFVFIDLMRVIVHSTVERRFRMDILFEALSIVVARDLIGILASVESADVYRLLTLSGLLGLVVLLWYFARRVERTHNISPPKTANHT